MKTKTKDDESLQQLQIGEIVIANAAGLKNPKKIIRSLLKDKIICGYLNFSAVKKLNSPSYID